MPSKHAKLAKALIDYLEAYPDIPSLVAYGGEAFTPPDDGGPYFIVDDVRLNNERVYYGTDEPVWQTGVFAVHVMVPIEWTTLQSAEYAGNLIEYFAQDTRIAYSDVSVKVAKTPIVDNTGYRDRDMYRIPVLVPWEGWV